MKKDDSRPVVKRPCTRIVEVLRSFQLLMWISILGNPHRQIWPLDGNMTNMAHHAFKVTVPMHRYEIRMTSSITLVEPILEPLPSALCARYSGSADLDTKLFQRLDLRFPARGSQRGSQIGTTGRVCTIWLIEAQDVADIRAVLQLAFDRIEERGSKVGVAGTPEHGNELDTGVVGVGCRGFGTIVVVP